MQRMESIRSIVSNVLQPLKQEEQDILLRAYVDKSCPKKITNKQIPPHVRLPERRNFHFERNLCDPLSAEIGTQVNADHPTNQPQLALPTPSDKLFVPHFTYALSLIQFGVYIISLLYFGAAPAGFGSELSVYGQVRMPSLIVDNVFRLEKRVHFLGLRLEDLILLGARYPPCMRLDPDIYDSVIERQKRWDRASGCCVSNDGAGCYQTTLEKCFRPLSTWYGTLQYASDVKGLYERASESALEKNSSMSTVGRVCGLDPRYCIDPPSEGIHKWSHTDVTEWPTCIGLENRTGRIRHPPHMDCQITGRPCCLNIKGGCIITTEEHCKFMRGTYHHKAALCSHINCLNQKCGQWALQMFTPLALIYAVFLHANLLHLMISLLVQIFLIVHFEQLIGTFNLACIFFITNINGGLLSGLFLPYQVATGPTHMGVLVLMGIDFFRHRRMVEDARPGLAIFILSPIILFAIGLLLIMDNVSNLGALFTAITCVPAITYLTTLDSNLCAPCIKLNNTEKLRAEVHKNRKSNLSRANVINFLLCIAPVVVLTVFLLTLFIFGVKIHCKYFSYFNCVPFTPNMCENIDLYADKSYHCSPFELYGSCQ